MYWTMMGMLSRRESVMTIELGLGWSLVLKALNVDPRLVVTLSGTICPEL